jgi:hypothetical protein
MRISATGNLNSVKDRNSSYFCGVFVNDDTRTNLEMVALPRPGPNCENLSGLLHVFKEQLNQPYKVDMRGCKVTARYYFTAIRSGIIALSCKFSLEIWSDRHHAVCCFEHLTNNRVGRT